MPSSLPISPAWRSGGDYFDLIDCGEKGVVLAIGDVCGKGMGAAILMSNLQATVRAEVRAGGDPLSIGERVNASLYANTAADKFVTLFLGILEPESGRLTYVNAGHDAPLLLRRGSTTCEELACHRARLRDPPRCAALGGERRPRPGRCALRLHGRPPRGAVAGRRRVLGRAAHGAPRRPSRAFGAGDRRAR